MLDESLQTTIKRDRAVSIGVKRVKLPLYMKSERLAIKDRDHHIVYRDDKWLGDLESFLTDRLISDIKRSLKKANVKGYPWSVDKRPFEVLEVEIEDFIYEEGKVFLKAFWRVNDREFFFDEATKSQSDSDSIVDSMNTLFMKLEKRVIESL
jgi:uncharacterized lipoprotein YmbA